MKPEQPQADDYRLEKRGVRTSFERVAERYDEYAVLQRQVGDHMLERLELIRHRPACIVDVGAGTGRATAALGRRYGKSRVIALDLAHGMLRRARRRVPAWSRWSGRYGYVCGDAERLPLADACADMIFSNLALQWCNDLDGTLAEFRRVLTPGGLLMFTTFGPDTLKELRASWTQIDGRTHVNMFIDMHDIGDALLRRGFSDPVMDVEHFTLTYPDIFGLMRDLKNLGAHNVTGGRPRALTGRGRLQALQEAYQRFARAGLLPATYEVIHGHAWAAQGAAGRGDGNAPTVAIPVDSIGRPGP